jgi:hypothetical protein
MIFSASALIFLLLLTFLFCRLNTRLSERTPKDVFLFLQKLDLEALYGAFHPEAEEHFRNTLEPEEFKRVQFKRIHLAVHYCNIISANARALQGWMQYERKDNWRFLHPELQEMARSLREYSMQCRMSAFGIRMTLRWWLVRMALAPFLPLPTFAALLELGSADMISFYENARALAESFSEAYGENVHRQLMEAL